MRILIDTNIILDVLQKREPHYIDSSKVWKLCETKQAEGFVEVLSFANMMYVIRKELSPERIEEVLKGLLLIFSFANFTESDIKDAVAMRWNDFEDAVQAVTATRIKADYIITRNVDDFAKSRVQAITPTNFLAKS